MGRPWVEAAGARPAVERSKLSRALGDRLPHPVDDDEEPPRREGPAAYVVRAHLQEQVAELKYRDPLVRHDVPDAVHKMRVAMRRLRSALATFRPLLDREQTEPLREELKWIASVLDRLDALVADPPWTPKACQPVESVLPARVANDYKRLRRRVSVADQAPGAITRNERLHEVRKAAKRTRYAPEAMEPVYGRPARQFAKAAKRVQSILGDQHDAVVTQAALRQLGVRARLDGENAFTYGLLQGVEHARAAALEAKYEDAWAHASRKKLRRWHS